jgi:hypothetical protein
MIKWVIPAFAVLVVFALVLLLLEYDGSDGPDEGVEHQSEDTGRRLTESQAAAAAREYAYVESSGGAGITTCTTTGGVDSVLDKWLWRVSCMNSAGQESATYLVDDESGRVERLYE